MPRRAASSTTILRRVQSELFDLGGELATPPAAFQPGMFRVGAARGDGARGS